VSIYISSTFEDLEYHREAVISALRRLESDYYAMEDYTASDERPVDKCLKDVADSEIYVGIFAWRYGTIPDGYDRSITELEYRTAIEHKIPTLIFLIKENHVWKPGLIDRGDKEKKVLSLRSELKKEKLLDFFTTPDDLSTKVITSIVKHKSLPKQDIIRFLESELKIGIQNVQIETIQGDRYDFKSGGVSELAQELGKQIPEVSTSYELALKAYTVNRIDEARDLIARAEEEKETELYRIYETHGKIEYKAGNYSTAVEYYKKTMALRPDDLEIQNRLLMALYGSGDYYEGVRLGEEVLAKREVNSDTDPTDVAASLNNLAGLYQAQGKYGEAEPLYRKSLKIMEKALGTKHPQLASTLSNLALLYDAQGRYAEAELLYQKSLTITEIALGSEHP